MILNQVYLYPNKIDVFTNSLATWTTERFRKVYNRNLKIYRGVDNKIDLQLRNADQRKIQNFTNHLVFILLNKETNEQIIKKDCVILTDDQTRNFIGRSYVLLSQEELTDIEKGFYTYSIHYETREPIENSNEYRVTSKSPLYADSQYGAESIIEIYGDISGEPVDSVVVKEFEKLNAFDSVTPVYYISSIIDAQPRLTVPQSLHTFQFYFTEYAGSVEIQASIDDQGGTPKNWTSVATLSSTNSNEYINITGKYSWFRIKHTPNNGTLDKILYR
jgi:hypothetical protein